MLLGRWLWHCVFVSPESWLPRQDLRKVRPLTIRSWVLPYLLGFLLAFWIFALSELILTEPSFFDFRYRLDRELILSTFPLRRLRVQGAERRGSVLHNRC